MANGTINRNGAAAEDEYPVNDRPLKQAALPGKTSLRTVGPGLRQGIRTQRIAPGY